VNVLAASRNVTWRIAIVALRTTLTMAVVVCAVFLLAEWLPGDAASGLVERGAPSATVAAVRTQLGLDRPIGERLIERIEGLARGDLGKTVRERPVSDVLAKPLQRTFVLAGCALALVVVVGISLGAGMAWRAGRAEERMIGAASVALLSLPEFVVLTLLALVLTSLLGWVPSVVVVDTAGRIDTSMFVLPVLALVLPVTAWTARLVRGAVTDALVLPHIEAAVLDGLPAARILLRHALPQALPAIAASLATSCAALLGGSVIVEAAVNYPGIGSVLTQGIAARDVTLVSSTVVVVSGIAALAFAAADLVRDLRPQGAAR
jgi:peptide/nickel transport system permease protein